MSASDNVLVKPLELATNETVGESPDLAAVYRRHAKDVMRWATRLSGRSAEAQDITQEVFCVVQRKLKSYRPGQARLSTWLFRITEHVTRARRRKERVYQFFFGDREVPVEVPSSERSADEELGARRDHAEVYRALDRLSDDDRTVLVLFELEGLSGEQVAELTGTKVSNVWVRLHRARKRFAKELGDVEVSA
jgi:RNA polymerase sigma-70 factor (ECF subfamily)